MTIISDLQRGLSCYEFDLYNQLDIDLFTINCPIIDIKEQVGFMLARAYIVVTKSSP